MIKLQCSWPDSQQWMISRLTQTQNIISRHSQVQNITIESKSTPEPKPPSGKHTIEKNSTKKHAHMIKLFKTAATFSTIAYFKTRPHPIYVSKTYPNPKSKYRKSRNLLGIRYCSIWSPDQKKKKKKKKLMYFCFA